MKILLITILLGVAALTGCKKDDEPNPFCGTRTTTCIDTKIQQIMAEPVTSPAAKIFSYNYNGQKAYYIPAPCCDFGSELYDENCKFICSPDGGFSGGGDGQCPDFHDKATDKTLVWEDTRTK